MESILTVPALETNAPSTFSVEGSGYVNALPPQPERRKVSAISSSKKLPFLMVVCFINVP
jgi:hypothetical protein